MKWTKISGPVAYRLANENSLSTKVDQLEKGVYQFELSVTDSLGLSGKDTVNIKVSEIQQSPGEIIFPDRPWIFPWNSSVEVRNFLSIVIENQSFKVFIREVGAANGLLLKELHAFPASIDQGAVTIISLHGIQCA